MTLTLGVTTGFKEGTTPVSYLGEANQLAIQLGNTGENPLKLAAADTSITATFGTLFAPADLTIPTGAGAWEAAWTGATLTLTPTADLSVSPNDVVNVPLGSVTPSGAARSETLTLECDYSNAFGPESVSATPSVPVHAQPSADTTRHLQLSVQFLPGYDVAYRTNRALLDTELANTLSFSISNPGPDPIVSAPLPAGLPAPEFRLWFTYAPDEQHPYWDALTTLERAATIGVSPSDATWHVDSSNAQDGYWLLQPQTTAILGAGDTATEIFTLDHLVTYLKPGVTLLYLQYRNIPGYDDGLITLPLEKREPSAGILSFAVDKPVVDAGDSVTLNWSAFAVESLVLEWSDGGNLVRKEGLVGLTQWPPQGAPAADAIIPSETTTFSLCAYDLAGNRVGDDWQQTVTLVDNPKVTTFTAVPGQVPQGGSVVLTWTTIDADAVVITTGDGSNVVPDAGAPSGTVTVTVNRGSNSFQIVPSRSGVGGPNGALTVEIIPTIATFTADPPFVPTDGAQHDVAVTWAVDDPAATLVLTPPGANNAVTVTGQTTWTFGATAGDQIVLTATKTDANGDDLVATQTLVVHYPNGDVFRTYVPYPPPMDTIYAQILGPNTYYLRIDDTLRAFPADFDLTSLLMQFPIPPSIFGQGDPWPQVPLLGAAGGCPVGTPLPESTYLAAGTPDGRVFLVVDGTRHWIVGPPVFNARGYSWGKIVSMDPAVLAAIPEGSQIA